MILLSVMILEEDNEPSASEAGSQEDEIILTESFMASAMGMWERRSCNGTGDYVSLTNSPEYESPTSRTLMDEE